MRWIKRGLIVLAGIILLAVGGLIINHRIETAESERFYAAHPMLRAMRDAPREPQMFDGRPHDAWPHMTDVLFRYVPRGMPREDAMRVMSSERLRCSQRFASDRYALMVCDPEVIPAHEPRWHIELGFDNDDKMVDGRALALKASMK